MTYESDPGDEQATCVCDKTRFRGIVNGNCVDCGWRVPGWRPVRWPACTCEARVTEA